MASLNGTLDGALLLGGCLDFNLTADGGGSNSTVMPEEQQQEYMENPLSYKVVATVMHVLIFLGGVFGNVVLILVARKTSSLQTPTYCYLVSLAYADLIVLFSAVPEAISFHHKRQWILGQVGCSLLVFGNFLGINAGSLSILAFTIERYIAVMRPMLAQKVCTVGRAKKVITVVWIISIIYCAPWLGLTEVKQDVVDPTVLMCDFRISGDQYIYFFMTDLVLFYFVPLLISAAVYTLIACKVKQRDNNVNGQKPKAAGSRGSTDHVTIDHTSYGSYAGGSTVGAGGSQHSRYPMAVSSIRSSTRSKRGRTQAMPMLVVVVVLFAVCWLPFRGLLVYNSIASEPWLDLWYLLFAKTLIYLNSAINPFLYNFMSRRFSDAVFRFLGIKRERSKPIDL